MTFSQKVHDILSHVDEFGACISWQPHGRAFQIRIPAEFEKQACPRYFGHKRYSSVLRQLNNHGFKTILVVRDPSHIDDAPQETIGHITEKEVDLIKPWRIITNNGNFDELHAQADAIIKEYSELFLRDSSLVKTAQPVSETSNSTESRSGFSDTIASGNREL